MTLRSRSWVIDFNRCSDKAQVRRATLSCDSSYCYCAGRFVSDLFENHIVGFPTRRLICEKAVTFLCAGKQCSLRCDTAVSHLELFCLLRGVSSKNEISRLMGKPTICIGENKDADQLRGNREADQRLCFRYSDSTIPLLLKSEISSF